jgi:hypothetical protein
LTFSQPRTLSLRSTVAVSLPDPQLTVSRFLLRALIVSLPAPAE